MKKEAGTTVSEALKEGGVDNFKALEVKKTQNISLFKAIFS